MENKLRHGRLNHRFCHTSIQQSESAAQEITSHYMASRNLWARGNYSMEPRGAPCIDESEGWKLAGHELKDCMDREILMGCNFPDSSPKSRKPVEKVNISPITNIAFSSWDDRDSSEKSEISVLFPNLGQSRDTDEDEQTWLLQDQVEKMEMGLLILEEEVVPTTVHISGKHVNRTVELILERLRSFSSRGKNPTNCQEISGKDFNVNKNSPDENEARDCPTRIHSENQEMCKVPIDLNEKSLLTLEDMRLLKIQSCVESDSNNGCTCTLPPAAVNLESVEWTKP